ncbi:ABC transporter ATP-binding protein/permease [Candidatus Pseudothioglobus singularis]|nr:ABC transporter ATP-binding protein/permease [Candidatus Pseudothioglobus singularis]
MYYILALTLLAGLAEGVGLLMLLPLLQSMDLNAVGGSSNIPTDSISIYMQSVLSALNLQDNIVAVILIIAFAFFVKGVLSFAAFGYSAYLVGQLQKDLKGQLFNFYIGMSYSYYSSRDTGHFINIINEQITRALQSFRNLTHLGTQVINALVYISFAFVVAWKFGLMALIASFFILYLFRWLNIHVRQLSRKTASENGHLAKLLIQTMHAFKYLSATGQTSSIRTNIISSIARLTDYQIRTGIAASLTHTVREPIAVILIMLIFLTQLVFLNQPVAPILVSILLFYRGINSVVGIQTNWQNTLEWIGSMELVHSEFEKQRQNQEVKGDYSVSLFTNSIQFSDVHFSYDSHFENVIKGVSLDIAASTSVGFVGESGSGKSTLVDLITLMLRPQQGQVLIDGVAGQDINLESWRSQIGYVSQETVVFDDSIANNICLWKGDPIKDPQLMDKIREASTQAHIANFIDTLPEGYETLVGDRGIRLSGGQRQRLFIARELFRKPNLLILDEATSSLDSVSERAIEESINELKGSLTVVIIAHRLSTIRNVDCIYVFEHGQLMEAGTYDDLKATKDSHFSYLTNMQSL